MSSVAVSSLAMSSLAVASLAMSLLTLIMWLRRVANPNWLALRIRLPRGGGRVIGRCRTLNQGQARDRRLSGRVLAVRSLALSTHGQFSGQLVLMTSYSTMLALVVGVLLWTVTLCHGQTTWSQVASHGLGVDGGVSVNHRLRALGQWRRVGKSSLERNLVKIENGRTHGWSSDRAMRLDGWGHRLRTLDDG